MCMYYSMVLALPCILTADGARSVRLCASYGLGPESDVVAPNVGGAHCAPRQNTTRQLEDLVALPNHGGRTKVDPNTRLQTERKHNSLEMKL